MTYATIKSYAFTLLEPNPTHVESKRGRRRIVSLSRAARSHLGAEAHGHGRVLGRGGGMAGTHVRGMIGEVALAIEMGAAAVDIGKAIHPHPRWARASVWPLRLRTVASRACRWQKSKFFFPYGFKKARSGN